ncbi:hypothetical protein AB0L63_12610 [Nocardia sp. NPDC051990]|uniref:hypothetical protein n=1 Tax=Nocardia sp. NPDC051990 TaxID=3155285 RepID=UPI00342AEE45
MSSAKTSTVLGLVRHATTLRLTRITTLVVGSLVFLHACEVSRKSDLSDVWVQVGVAAGFALIGLIAAWFEVRAADHATTRARTDIRGFRIESDGITVRARITRSGDLVFHGHDTSGAAPAYEWDWAFRTTTFSAIRAALGGGRGDLMDLLEHTVPDLDRHDPGAWLHNQGIPAAFRERGDTSHRITRELPVLDPEAPRRDQSRESIGAHKLSSKRRNVRDHVDPPRPSRSRRQPPDQDTPAPTRHRADAPRSQNHRNSDNRFDEPPTRRDQPSNTRRRASERSEWRADRTGERPRSRRNESLDDSWDEQPDSRHHGPSRRPFDQNSGAHHTWSDPYGHEPPSAHRQGLSGAHPSEPSRPSQREPWGLNEQPVRRHRRS